MKHKLSEFGRWSYVAGFVIGATMGTYSERWDWPTWVQIVFGAVVGYIVPAVVIGLVAHRTTRRRAVTPDA